MKTRMYVAQGTKLQGENKKEEVTPLRHHLFYGRDKIDMTSEGSTIAREKA